MNILVAAAIKYPNGEVVTASRHYQVIAAQAAFGIRSIGAEQGFVDNTGKFYTREEAKELALKNGQISKDHKGTLYSEDLWEQTERLIDNY